MSSRTYSFRCKGGPFGLPPRLAHPPAHATISTTMDRLIGIRRGNRPATAPEFDLRLFFIAAGILVITLTWPLLRAADAPAPSGGTAYSEKIPGSTVSIDMVPTPAGEFKPEGKDPLKIKPLY